MNDIVNQFIGDHFSTIVIRILFALVLSGLIGFEREIHNHSAGFRTHILVGIGSCLMMLLSLYGFESLFIEYAGASSIRFDPARLPSYVVSGIGFLGAGTIIVYGGTIRGLTTAASIWTVAGIGLVVGAGMYSTAILTTIVILVSLSLLNNFHKLFKKRRRLRIIEIIAQPDIEISHIFKALEVQRIKVKSVEVINVENNLKNIFIKTDDRQTEINRSKLLQSIMNIKDVKNVSIN